MTFQIRRTRKYRFLLFKNQFLGTAPDPPDPADPPEMEHEVRLPTHQQRAGGQDDVSLNKLPQISNCLIYQGSCGIMNTWTRRFMTRHGMEHLKHDTELVPRSGADIPGTILSDKKTPLSTLGSRERPPDKFPDRFFQKQKNIPEHAPQSRDGSTARGAQTG